MELLPDVIGAPRTLAVAELEGPEPGPSVDYRVRLSQERSRTGTLIGKEHRAVMEHYPRWSSSVWDLLARAICTALTGKEQLPRRPTSVGDVVPTRKLPGEDFDYVCLADIPQPARAWFDIARGMRPAPFISWDQPSAYADDWTTFLTGRWPA